LSTHISDYDFDLPPELIAPRPLASRDASRMMVIDRAKGTIEHRMFRDFPEFLRKDDLVVLNNSRVIKARLRTEDRRIEILLLEPTEGNCWKCLVKPGRKMRVGAKVAIAGVEATVRQVFPEGERLVEFSDEPDLECYGAMPIPPYFNREADAEDDTRYQTVFAEAQGSVAAPTAGLHFTPEILANIPHAFITLHVGIGTFQPVKAEIVEEHRMHEERYEISKEAAGRINAASRLVAIGTTATRVLESQPPGPVLPHAGSTDIFIHPPMSLSRVGALLTNFHLPRSTLLMLVSAFAGKDLVFAAYEEAVGKSYRFFSYGDCMLVT
jgi:S-adenosylmethionine:tRNA ribosyltransferase-isomerase